MCKSLFGFIFKAEGGVTLAQEENPQTGTKVHAEGETPCLHHGGGCCFEGGGEQRRCVTH